MLQLGATPAKAPRPGERLMAEESRLHERVVQRDESALLECFDRMGGLVYCIALARTGDQAAAEELTEAVFVAFWRDPAAFSPSHGPVGLQLLRRMTPGRVSVSPRPPWLVALEAEAQRDDPAVDSVQEGEQALDLAGQKGAEGILKMSDMLTDGIIAQFPDRFA